MREAPDESSAERPFRSLMTFGTRDGAPDPDLVQQFERIALPLTTDVPIGIQNAFLSQHHDMSRGSDGLLLIDGVVLQAAAELWAAERILLGRLALLTMFHHARALYEAHALVVWTLKDFDSRWPRVIKDRLLERVRFEKAASSSIGIVATDVSPVGHQLLADPTVKQLPTMFDMIQGNAVLEFDHAVFWKYSSAHTHPGHISAGQIDSYSERVTIHQILGGLIRHSAGTYRSVVDRFRIDNESVLRPLEAAESFARYLVSPEPDPGERPDSPA